MNKHACFVLAGMLFGCMSLMGTGSAAELTVENPRVQAADQAISQGKTTVDKLLSTMQTIHEGQKSSIINALAVGNQLKAEKTLQQWSELYPLTTHLYELKSGKGITLMNKAGDSYTLKNQTPLEWLHVMRGDEEYYRFPAKDTFLELDFTFNQTGVLKQEMTLESSNTTSSPIYFYDGEDFLSDLRYKKSDSGIAVLKNSEDQRYFFFDVADSTLQDESAKISLTDGSSAALSQLYRTKSYSPAYFITSLDAGFQYCKNVADFAGATSLDKEYSASDCENAAKGIFTTRMHKDILEYAASLKS